MKINRFLGIASLALVFSSSGLSAQYYYPVALSGGFNGDAIANGVGPAVSSTTIPIDNGSSTTENNAYLSKDYQPTAASPVLTFGLPINGQFWGAVTTTQGLTYQLAPYAGQNTLKLSATNDTGTLSFATATAANTLYLLTTGGGGSGVLSAVVNFSDGSIQSFTNLAVADWYNGTGFAIQGIGRVKIDTDVVDPASGTNPRMYQIPMTIIAANQSKTITSVALTKTSGSGLLSIFAISADKYSSCVAPTAITVSAIAATSATVSWTAPSTPPSNYDVYYTSATVAPSNIAAPSVAGVTGITTPIGGLVPNTQYYVWVRSKCGATTGEWAYATTFKSACGAVTSLSENFDSYAAAAVLPDCWGRLVTTGTLSINNTTPASGTRNVYQTSSTAQVPTTAVLPEFSNVNAGTHWLRLKARVNTATGTLNVGYVTNPTDASTFVLIQALSIANTNYVTNSEYGVIVPSTVPANARLAIRNTADGKGYYWDDVNWEVIPACLPPTSVSASAVTANTVTASWTAPSSAPANGYEYYYSTANTAPIDTSTPTGSIAAGNVSSVISGFNPSTTYYLWLRSSCSTTSKSTWSYVGTFTTLCAAVLPPYTNDFSTVPGNCWSASLSGGTPATGPTGTNGIWVSGAFLNTGTVNSMRVNLYDVNRTGWLKTNAFDLSAGGYRVKFDYGLTTYNGTGASTMGSDDNVQFLVSNDGGSTWTSLQTWNTSNTPTNTSTTYSFDLTGYNGANTVFAFYGTDGTVNDTQDYDFHVDNFKVELANLGTSESTAMNKKLSIHPNPFKDVIYISDSKDIKSVTVYDVAGRVVKQVNDSSKEIHLAELKEGLYMIKVSFKDGTESVTKAIKK